jgi:hypothetical protein
MTNSTKCKFERAFAGKTNAGLRAAIRDAVSGHRCGPANEASVLGLAREIALQPWGVETLKAVAADYRAVNGGSKVTCDCDSCHARALQGLGALG